MNNSDFTQLASDGKQAASNPLEIRYGRVAETTFIPDAAARTLSTLYRALQGISSITQILIGSALQDDLVDGTPLSPYTAHNLMCAVQALSEYAIDDIEHVADWSDRRAKEESEARHGQ